MSVGRAEGEISPLGFLPGPTAMVLVGGLNHGVEQSATHVIGLLEESGLDCDVVDEPEALATLDHDLLVVAALWWRMLPDRYAATRPQWARELGGAARAAIEAHVTLGRPLLAIHTASICFDDWPRWGEIVGGAWNWERSSHPPLDADHPAVIDVVSTDHPIVAGLRRFEVIDEVYGCLDLQPDLDVLATSRRDGVDHPVLWSRTLPSGSRVVYDALGHDERSVLEPTHHEVLRRSIAWVGEDVHR